MDPLQEPPVGYSLALPVLDVAQRAWFRIHNKAYGALYFDRGADSRFNAPAGEFGVMYISESESGAFAETMLRKRQIPLAVSERNLHTRALTTFTLPRLRLADLTGNRITSLGLDSRIASDDCYDLARRWALWFHNHPAQVDGIAYFARHAPGTRSVGLFDRSGGVVSQRCLEPSLMPSPGHPSARALALLTEFDVGLLPNSF